MVWLFGGTKTRRRPVEGGRQVRFRCEDCAREVDFVECEVTDKAHVFFVELIKTTNRRMVCVECGEDHDVDELFEEIRKVERRRLPAATHKLASKPPVSRLGEAKVARDDAQVDAMLAELKRKMGQS